MSEAIWRLAQSVGFDDYELKPMLEAFATALSQPAPLAGEVTDGQIRDALIKKHARGLYSSSQLDWEVAEFHRFGLLQLIDAILALRPQAVPMTLPQVEGDVLPPVGSKVLIHLASSDSWAEHEVVGYYVWEAINELAKPRHHRVFVRVRDSDGILNARHLCDVRGITAKAEGKQE